MKQGKRILIAIASLITIMFASPSCSKSGGDDDGPSIQSIDPASGLTGASIKITGKNLSAASVTIGGISSQVKDNTETSLNTTIPSGASTGNQKVVVTTSDGSAETSINITGKGAAPVITAINPKEASIGQTITITGTGLAGATVEIATKLSQVSASNATSVTATVPSGIALGAASVRVTTALGTVVSSMTIK